MDKLRAMELFVRLADLGSFTKVAQATGTSKSMVSKEISRLEDALGARLIHRTTRHVQLTDIGDGYLARCRKLLMQMEDAENFVEDMQGTPKGKLRVSASMALGITHLGQAFADFMGVFPEIELDIHLSDEPIDLVEQGFDLGFRAASRQFDSQYIGKRVTVFSYKVCASPDYVERHATIESPSDLMDHNCFIYSYFRGGDIWPLGDGVNVSGNLKVNNTVVMLEAIRQGRGIGFVPEFVARDALMRGDVVELLADVERPELTLYAMYPERQFVPPKIRHCVSFLQSWFQQNYKA